MRSGVYLLPLSARGAQRHGARNTRRETRDGRRSSIMHPPLSRPITRQTLPDPPKLPYPTRRCEERPQRAPRSSTLHLHNARRHRDCPVAGVIREVVRLRSAVEE
eukprot:1128242-Prymnesium_polylepis.1